MTRSSFFTWRQAVVESSLAATTKLVLLTLSCHMNDLGESCFPSVSTLCKETSLSNRSVVTHLDKARELGWIRVTKHGFGDQRWKRNQYEIGLPDDVKGSERGSPPPQKGSEPLAKGGEPRDRKVVKEVHTSTSVNSPSNEDDDAREPVPGEQDLPSWVPVGTWREFYRHRAVIRKPLSIPGQRQVVKRLTELRGQGADIGASLEQTMAAGLAIPVTPRDPDQPGDSHANRNPSRKTSVVERIQANIASRRATERRAGPPVDENGVSLRPCVDQPVR